MDRRGFLQQAGASSSATRVFQSPQETDIPGHKLLRQFEIVGQA